MKNSHQLKPIYRNKLRIFFGKQYYTIRRCFYWCFGSEKYARIQTNKKLENQIFKHKTPIYRELKNVDMWLQENKAENLKIAIKKVDGILIRPGETFSYWKSIGKPTRLKGYKKGMQLHYGKFITGIGGGLCQLSNLLYWIVLHTPLTVVERHRHSFDVFPDSSRTQPFGSGATCVYNYRDLRISNKTDEIYQINLRIEDECLVGEISTDAKLYFKYRIYEKEHKITHEYWGSYVRHNLIMKEVVDLDNNLIHEEYVCENHALMMYEPLLSFKNDKKDYGRNEFANDKSFGG